MRTIVLNSLKSGINRLRDKGGADPSSLYDLVNGYVTIDGGIRSRPGFPEDAALPVGTVGLCAFQDQLYVFAASNVGTAPSGYVLQILPHPTDPDRTITRIHFAAPFMGRLYVVAEFDNGDVFHYWAPPAEAWRAKHQYDLNATVQPTVPNGLYYKIGNTVALQAWQPSTTYQVDDVVVPSTLNGWKYTCIEAVGANPSSGTGEPKWPLSDGATVAEERNAQPPVLPPQLPPSDPGGDRYNNPAGGGGGSGRVGTRIKIQ